MSEKSITHTLTISDGEKNYTCKLREPEFEEYSMSLIALKSVNGKTNIAGAGKFILESCWVEGDDEIRNNSKLLFNASIFAFELIDFYDGEIKKN